MIDVIKGSTKRAKRTDVNQAEVTLNRDVGVDGPDVGNRPISPFDPEGRSRSQSYVYVN